MTRKKPKKTKEVREALSCTCPAEEMQSFGHNVYGQEMFLCKRHAHWRLVGEKLTRAEYARQVAAKREELANHLTEEDTIGRDTATVTPDADTTDDAGTQTTN